MTLTAEPININIISPDDLMDREGAASYLGCSVRHIDGLINRGELVAYKAGRKMTRIPRKNIDAYLKRFETSRTE